MKRKLIRLRVLQRWVAVDGGDDVDEILEGFGPVPEHKGGKRCVNDGLSAKE